MSDPHDSTEPAGLPLVNVDLDVTARAIRCIVAALREATPRGVQEAGVVERVVRGAAGGAADRLETLATLLEVRSLVEVGAVARLLFELEVAVGFVLVPEGEAGRVERADRFEAWDTFRAGKTILTTSETFPVAGLGEHYPSFAGVLDNGQILGGIRREVDALRVRFPGIDGWRTWSGMTLKEMANAVARKSGRPSPYTLLYPMLSLFSHPSSWSIARPATARDRYLAMLLAGIFPLQSAAAVYTIWRQAWPETAPPPLKAHFDQIWSPEKGPPSAQSADS